MIDKSGFTLFEILLAVVIMGIIAGVTSSISKVAFVSKRSDYLETQKKINNNIAQALITYAYETSASCTLPTPFTTGEYAAGVCDPTNTALIETIKSFGVVESEVNDDGSHSNLERAYAVADLSITAPFFGSVGPVVTLNYQILTLYTSKCGKDDASCDSTANDNGGFTKVTYSTLPQVREKKRQTVEALLTFRDAFVAQRDVKLLSATPGDTSNFFFNPTTIGFTDLSGQDPALNENCYSGWYSAYLEVGGISIPEAVGLNRDDVGLTPFDALVEYCPDYDSLSAGEDTAPHYAALRINVNISTNNDPDGTNDIIITF